MICEHWSGGRYCSAPGAHLFIVGRRCAAHTPAALAGRPEALVDPELTLTALQAKAGITYVYRRTDSSLVDQRAVASGRRRSNSREYRQAQKQEHERRIAEKARRRNRGPLRGATPARTAGTPVADFTTDLVSAAKAPQ